MGVNLGIKLRLNYHAIKIIQQHYALDSQGRSTVAHTQFCVNVPLKKSSHPALQ